jgi:hypothetical protein
MTSPVLVPRVLLKAESSSVSSISEVSVPVVSRSYTPMLGCGALLPTSVSEAGSSSTLPRAAPAPEAAANVSPP